MVCRVSHVQQLFLFGFCLMLLDEVWRRLVMQLNGGRKQLVGRLTFSKIILGYLNKEKKEKKKHDVWFSHYAHVQCRISFS